MPLPDNSPVPTTSPSAIRREILSPNPGAQISTAQWQITRIPIHSSTQTESIDETFFGESEQSNMPRRTLMNVMRSAVPERRRSRAQSQAVHQQPQGDEVFSSFVMQLANTNGAQGFDAIASNIANQRQSHRSDRQTSPLRHKLVYQLRCIFCMQRVCNRAMKAILLADTKIELYSTDIPPHQLQMMNEDRMTHGCHCRIRDTLCSCCGNVLGYHVSQPCERCLDAKNNGHFWMFYSETVQAYERPDPSTGKPLFWGSLSPMREFEEIVLVGRYETYCR